MDQYRPISLANFKHKVLNKILADRLAYLLAKIISKEQNSSIHGIKISDFIYLASEATNLLNKKTYAGNVALKIDIYKVFDTLH